MSQKNSFCVFTTVTDRPNIRYSTELNCELITRELELEPKLFFLKNWTHNQTHGSIFILFYYETKTGIVLVFLL